jgi:TPR repeat protein
LFKNKHWSALEGVSRDWVKDQPKNPVAYSFYANAFLGQGNYSAALIYIDQSIALGLKESSIYLNRGIVNRGLKNNAAAINDFRKCLAIDSAQSACENLLSKAEIDLSYEKISQKDFDGAAKLLEAQARKGNPTAQTNLGYSLSQITSQNDELGQKRIRDLYEKSDAQGNAIAPYNLYLIYLQGKSGIQPDKTLAIKYLEKSANLNWSDAQYTYALQFLPNGLMPEDKDQAKKWLLKSIENKQSSPDQVNRAKAMLARLSSAPEQNWIAASNVQCKVWNSRPLPEEKIEWSGPCNKGIASGYGTAKWIFPGGSYQAVTGTYKDGKRVDGPAETIDTRYDLKTTGTIVNGKWNGPAQRTNLKTGIVTNGNMEYNKFTPSAN